jgi:hypothetical protein
MIDDNHVSSFYVLDFDRTLANTDAFHDILERVIEHETTIRASYLREARKVAEASGESFDTIDYLRHFLTNAHSEKTWHQIQKVFIEQAQQEDMLEPHAAEFLRLLDEKKLPYGIITFGGEAWQLAKIEAANLMDVPHIVTHIQEKGRILSGWKHQSSDTFIIPPALTRSFQPMNVSTIVFLDDKAKSFVGMPDGVRGVHIRSLRQPPLPAQLGSLPVGVTGVEGLQGAIALLFDKDE